MAADQQTAEFKVVKHNVNGKVLCDKISQDVESNLINGGIIWGSEAHRLGFIEFVQDYLMQLEETGVLTQGNVMCDTRNNDIADMDMGIYKFEVSFKQKNCLNTTRLVYIIKDLLVASLQELFDLKAP